MKKFFKSFRSCIANHFYRMYTFFRKAVCYFNLVNSSIKFSGYRIID